MSHFYNVCTRADSTFVFISNRVPMKYLLLAALFFLFCITARAQYHPQFPQPVTLVAASANPAKATAALINTIPPAVRAKADSYSEGGYWLLLWNFLYAAFVAWVFLFGGLSAYIKKLACRTVKKNLSNLIYITLYFVFAFVLALPLDIYQNFIREQQYGFSNQPFLAWFIDDLITFLVELIIAAPFFVLIYALFRKVKASWWLWGAGLAVTTIIAVLVIYPVFIAPLFNNYTPLKNSAIKQQLLSMARANQVNIRQVYVYDESQQTKAFNANVTGFGSTTRIALNDNILKHRTDKEIKAIIGHEMGHYVLNHLSIMVLEFGVLIVIGFRLVKYLLNKLLAGYSKQWQAASIQDITSLPALVFLFTLYFFILTPLTNTIMRTAEIEADNYGLNAAREPGAFASVWLKTADNHKVSPGYWEEVFFYDHPCREKRILAAMIWMAENRGTR